MSITFAASELRSLLCSRVGGGARSRNGLVLPGAASEAVLGWSRAEHGIKQTSSRRCKGYWEYAMSKTLFFLLLAVASTSASARWEKVFAADNMSAYVENASIRKKGNTATVSLLEDWKPERTAVIGGTTILFMSYSSQWEIQCKAKRIRQVSGSEKYWAKNMASGGKVWENSQKKSGSKGSFLDVGLDPSWRGAWERACFGIKLPAAKAK